MNIIYLLNGPPNISEPLFTNFFICLVIPISVFAFIYSAYKRELILTTSLSKTVIKLGFVIIGFIITLTGLLTNNDFNFNETPILFLSIAVLYKDFLPSKKQRSLWFLIGFVIPIISISISSYYNMASRTVVKAVGDGLFYENSNLIPLHYPYIFKNLKVGSKFVRVLKEIDYVMKDYYHQDGGFVFFGPRIDFGYAVYHLLPYPGLPLWWEIFQNGNSEAAKDKINEFKRANFSLCIFLRDDYTFIPHQIIEYLKKEYRRIDFEEITIYIKPSIR